MQNMIFSKAICLKDRFVGEASVSNSFSSDVVDIKGKTLRGEGLRGVPATVPQMREDGPCIHDTQVMEVPASVKKEQL